MNMAAVSVIDEVDIEQRQTLWVGGLNEKVTEEILYELFQNVSFSNISTFRIYEVGFLDIINFIQKKLSTNKSNKNYPEALSPKKLFSMVNGMDHCHSLCRRPTLGNPFK